MNESESSEDEDVVIVDSKEKDEEILRYVNRFELINNNKKYRDLLI